MKKIIGIAIVLLSMILIGIIILRIWNIEIISIENLMKSVTTLVLIGVANLLLLIVYGFLMRNDNQDYNKTKGNRAHPKL